MIFASLAVITFQVTFVQSFYGSRSTVQFGTSSPLSYHRSLSGFRTSDVIRSSGLKQLKNYERSRRVYAASTEATNNSVDTVKAIAVDVPNVIIVGAPVTPSVTSEHCNWPAPVPYSQLTVGVPKEKLDGEICSIKRYASPVQCCPFSILSNLVEIYANLYKLQNTFV
jgi:hypothetical protein